MGVGVENCINMLKRIKKKATSHATVSLIRDPDGVF